MESLLPLLIQLLAGVAGGNIVGLIFNKLSLGFMGNALAGMVGGVFSGPLLISVLGIGLQNNISEGLAAAAVGGALTFITGLIRKFVNPQEIQQ